MEILRHDRGGSGSTCACGVMSVPLSWKPASFAQTQKMADRRSCDHARGKVALTCPEGVCRPRMMAAGDLHHAGKGTHTHLLSRSFPNIPLLMAAKQRKRCIITISMGRIRQVCYRGRSIPSLLASICNPAKYVVPRILYTQ